MVNQRLSLLIGNFLILISRLSFGGWLWYQSREPKLKENFIVPNELVESGMAIRDKQAKNKRRNGYNLQENTSEQLLFLRAEWVDEWEPGFPECASQLIVDEFGKVQWAAYTRETIKYLYTSHIQYDSLISKTLEVNFFNLRNKYITKIMPWDPLQEGHPAQINIVVHTTKRKHTIFAEQKLMPFSLQDFSTYLKHVTEKISETGQPAIQGIYIRIIPLSGNSVTEIKNLGVYNKIGDKELALSSALREGLKTPYSFIRLGQEKKQILEILGKRKGKYFYPFFKSGPVFYKVLKYTYNRERNELLF